MRLGRRSLNTTPPLQTIRAEIGSSAGIGKYNTYSSSWSRDRAMLIPTISRSRDLIASIISSSTLKSYAKSFDGTETVEIPLAPEPWFDRLDPNNTNAFTLSWLLDDLYFTGRAYLAIVARWASGYPSQFQWIPAANVTLSDQAGPLWFGPSNQIQFNGTPLDPADVVQFISPNQGILSMGARAILIAQRLDEAALRFASNDIPAGWLQASANSEPMSGEELSDLANAWSQARQTNSIAALSGSVEWHESSMDPSRLQLVEARQQSALELSRVGNIPGYMVGAPSASGMTYLNPESSVRDLWVFGAKPFAETISQTLSSNQVVPRGRYVKLEPEDYHLSDPFTPTDNPGGAPL